MALTKKISVVPPDEAITAVQTAIGAVESALPFLIDLTPEEVSADLRKTKDVLRNSRDRL